eukprot:s13_g51.t1
MAHLPPKTLDIKQPQIIRHFPLDAGGFYWHHRVLLEKTAPGQWIALSPDGDLERVDLTTVTHIPLDRRSDFPLAQAPYVYAFDELSRAELESHVRRAKLMSNLFNDASLEEIDSYEWVVGDPSRPDFGEAFKDEDLDDAVTLQDHALIEYEGEVVYAVRIASNRKVEWIKSKEQTKGDARLLGDHRDSQGRRFLEFQKALDLMTSIEFTDWPLSGPRCTMELLRSIREGTSDLTSYHLQWARNSGVSSYAACLHEHRAICDYLRYFITIDQVDVSNLLGIEMMCRRLVTIETAVTRNPQVPDFTGLELLMENSIGQTGEARTTKFTEWVSSKLKEKAQVQKQARLYKEEFGKGRASGDQADHDGKGRGRGGGRGKPKGRGGAGAPAATA